ncbi:MAG TPA: acetate--CoA ligase family protein [Thermodesulfovibrionales bacterium]|nr:acetate--CoA ligase family protein [Thermodesulfovibrionales bacterium]
MTSLMTSPAAGTDSGFSKSFGDFIKKNKGRTTFLEHEVKGLLKEMGFSVPKGKFLGIGEGLPRQLDLNYPLVAKVSSSRIASKTNVGGVRTGIANNDELGKAVQELSLIERAEGVLLEEMAPEGTEVIVGGVVDHEFGPIVMFGLGGIFVEVFKDVAFGLAPLNLEDALRLVQQIRGYRLLDGYRGKPPVDIDILLRILVAVSDMMATGFVSEVDLNPVALYPGGLMVLDAKMQLIP